MLEIFTYTDADFSVSETEEASMILAAQAGDEAAKLDLIRAYGPVLRATVRRFGNGIVDGRTARGSRLEAGNTDLDVADLQSAALVSFLELIESHDAEKSPRLAGRVSQHLAASLGEEFAAVAAFTVPTRTLKRFYGILKNAEGDVEVAERIAPDFGMSHETFRDVLSAVRGTGSLDGLTDEDEGGSGSLAASPVTAPAPVVDVEDRMLVDMAFAAVTDEEARICELAYGFTEYEPVSDAEIAHRIGLTRPTVQRKRGKALDTMRKTIGVTGA